MAYYQQHYPLHAGHQMPRVPFAGFPGYPPNRYHPVGQAVTPYCWDNVYRANPKTESKPRLSKEEVDKLEAEFLKNNKPNSSRKKSLAEQLGVDIARINNWFQNRRAKKKQMIRTAEIEASRKLESIKSEPASPEVKDDFHTGEENDDLQPAVIPPYNSEPSSPSQTPHHSAEAVYDSMATLEGIEKLDAATEEMQSEYASSLHGLSQHNDAAFDFAPATHDTFAHSTCDFSGLVVAQPHVIDCQVTAEMIMSAAPAPSMLPAPMVDIESSGYGHFQLGMMDSLSDAELKQSIPAVVSHMDQDIPHPSVESGYSQETSPIIPLAQSPQAMNAQNLRLKSSSIVDLASRRRRPPPAPLGIRNASHGPVTGMNFGARVMDPGSPSRRVASAPGFAPQGVRKTPIPPRSPFHDRHPDSFMRFFHAQAPAINTGINTGIGFMAPPTPDTPVVPPQSVREATVSSCSSEEDQNMLRQTSMSSLGSVLDHNGVRTPPVTPSNMPDMYPFSNIAFTVNDEAVLTPSLHDTFPDISASPYSNSCASQPATPIGFQAPFSDGTQYTWPRAQPGSPASSPNARVRQLQFNNITAEHFNPRK